MWLRNGEVLADSNNEAGAVCWNTMVFGIQQSIADIKSEAETERIEQVVGC